MNNHLVRYSRLVPGPVDLVFMVVLAMLLIGGRHGLLSDPGTSWHLRLGREIVATGSVPRFDMLTFTHERTSWVDQSWAFDVALALIVDSWGWSAAIGLSSLCLATLYAALARDLIRDGRSPVVAVVVALLVTAIGSIHFLIRPHLVTFAFAYLTLRACQKQHEKGGWAVALVPLYTALLANLHGGFIALPVIVATAAIGHTVSGAWDAARRRNVLKFLAAVAACAVAALANPYGFGLYRHVYHLLVSSGVTSLIIEYQPAPFGKPEAQELEWVLLAFVALPIVSTRRIERYQMAHVLVWLHLALTSIRNAPFFAMAAAPALATLLDGLPLPWRTSWKLDRRPSIWPAAATLSLLLLIVGGVKLGGFDPAKWPLAALPTLNRQPTAARMFHEQDWGGLIEAECQPVRRSYVDDRFEIFGKKEILEYIDVLFGGPAWDTVCERDKIELVWLKPDRGLAKRLLKDPQWSVIYRDKVSILFRQRLTPQVACGRENWPRCHGNVTDGPL
jgi:hypothetical protein